MLIEIGVDDKLELLYLVNDEDNNDADNIVVALDSDTGDDSLADGFLVTNWDDEDEDMVFVMENFVEIVLVIDAVEAFVVNGWSVVIP